MSVPSSRRRLAALSVAALAAAGFTAFAPSATGQGNPHAVTAATRVHWAHGKALGARSDQGAADAVRGYLSTHGLGKAAAASLRPSGQWTQRGVTLLRMQQDAAGLRVVGSDVKAALRDGRPVSVVENASAVGTPAAARVGDDDAKRAAIDSVYHGRAVTFLSAPTVERVAVPISNGGLAEGFVVTTWDDDNQLRETLVDGDGVVVRSELRTAEDGYNVFAEDPDTSTQTLVTDQADLTVSPQGWLSGTQYVDNISGNNAHAYLDADANNRPDKAGAVDSDGVFDKAFDPSTQPSAGDNKAVAVQNLFYLNNLIHDTLYRAGFTAAAGNFQSDNFGLGGRGGDPVLAEAQDGSGTDNANFATPNDGRSGRMQMYLWSVPGTSEVVQGTSSYNAPVAEFSAPLTSSGLTGPLVVANDGVGTASDACEALPAVPAGSVVIADRGTCAFTVKASNIKAAGAAGLVVANNDPTAPFVMGGTIRRFGLPAVMVSQADGAALKAAAPAAVTLRLVTPAPPMKDGDLDTDIVWHEYGHGLTWRMIGNMSGPMSGAIGEGMSDVLSVIINDDPIVGEYSFSDPAGIRSHSYEGYETYRTYGDVAGTEVHFDGEVYGAIGWDLWKQYRDAGLGRSAILSDLVMGMNFTPAGPNFQQMRDGILDGMVVTNTARACMVWNSFAKYGVGVNATSTVTNSGVTATEDFSKPAGCP